MLLFSEQECAAGGYDNLDAKSLVIVTLRQATLDPSVISLTDIGPVEERIKQLEIPVRALRMRPGMPNPWSVVTLAKRLALSRTDVVQTWMWHADLIGGL